MVKVVEIWLAPTKTTNECLNDRAGRDEIRYKGDNNRRSLEYREWGMPEEAKLSEAQAERLEQAIQTATGKVLQPF